MLIRYEKKLDLNMIDVVLRYFFGNLKLNSGAQISIYFSDSTINLHSANLT